MKAWILLILLLLLGCRSAKKTSESLQFSEQKTTSDTLSRTVSQSAELNVNLQVDKSIKKVSVGGVKIYPKGEFTITSEGTFQGSADSVVTTIQQKTSETIHISDLSQIKLDSTAQESSGSKSDSDTALNTESNSTKRTPNLIPYIGIGLILIGLIAFVMWRLKIL